MAIVKGTVSAISRKRIGQGTAFSFMVDDNWYRHGWDEPKFKKGYLVQFDDEPIDQYGVIDTSTVKFKKGEPQVTQGNRSNWGGKKNNQSQGENWEARQKYWDEKDKRDIVAGNQYNYRSAFHVAVELINKGVELEMIKLGAKNASGPKRWEAYLLQIDQLASDIHNKFLNAGEAKPEVENDTPMDDDDGWEGGGTSSSDDQWPDNVDDNPDEWED